MTKTNLKTVDRTNLAKAQGGRRAPISIARAAGGCRTVKLRGKTMKVCIE